MPKISIYYEDAASGLNAANKNTFRNRRYLRASPQPSPEGEGVYIR